MAEEIGSRMTLSTSDGERLAALHLPPRDDGGAVDPDARFAVVLAPGFSGWSGKPAVRRVAADLWRSTPAAGLVVLDLRGHGRSSGVTTFGDREVLDIDAAVGAARRLGYRRVVTLGWSMGASCVLRHSALIGEQVHGHPVRHAPDAVATVSAVSRWDVRDTAAMRRVHRMIETRSGRLLARRVFRVRIDPAGWATLPLSPAESIARIEVPLLVVHGENDNYFGWDHARALAEAAADGVVLWLVRGLGHAEEAAARPDVPGFLEALGAALAALAAGRPVPEWPEPAQAGVAPGRAP